MRQWIVYEYAYYMCVLRLSGKLILPLGNVGWCNKMMNSLLCATLLPFAKVRGKKILVSCFKGY